MPIDIDQSHYNTGTATVAGTAATGFGTTWLSLKAGDLWGTHRGLAVRIASITDNTNLTLAHDVAALYQTNAAYEVQRTPDDLGYHQAINDLLVSFTGLPYAISQLDGTGGEKGIEINGTATAVTYPLKAFGKTLSGTANQAAAYTALGMSAYFVTLLDDADASAALSTLGVSTFIKTVLDDASAAAALVTLGAAGIASPTLTGTAKITGTTGGIWRVATTGGTNLLDVSADAAGAYLYSYANVPLYIATNNVARLIIDASGRRTEPYQPTVSVKGPAATFTTAATRVPFGTPDINIGTAWASGYFTAPVTGRYLVTFLTNFDNVTTSGAMDLRIRKNSAIYRNVYESRNAASVIQYTNIAIPCIVPLTAGDILDVFLGTGSVGATTGTDLSIYLLG